MCWHMGVYGRGVRGLVGFILIEWVEGCAHWSLCTESVCGSVTVCLWTNINKFNIRHTFFLNCTGKDLLENVWKWI